MYRREIARRAMLRTSPLQDCAAGDEESESPGNSRNLAHDVVSSNMRAHMLLSCRVSLPLPSLAVAMLFALRASTTLNAQSVNPPSLVAERVIRASVEDLSEVHATHLLPDGSIALLQRQDSRVVVFDSSGRRKYELGRAGGGPGEFGKMAGRSSIRTGVFADTVWVYDPSHRWFTLFVGNRLATTVPLHTALSGAEELLRDRAREKGELFLAFDPLAMTSARRAVGVGSFGYARKVKDEMQGRPLRRAVVAVDLSTGKRTELLRLAEDSSQIAIPLTPDSSSMRYLNIPYRRATRLVASDDGTRFATVASNVDGEKPTITLNVYGDDGKLRFTRTWPIPPVVVTRRMVDSVLDESRRGLEAMLPPRSRARVTGQDAAHAGEVRKRAPRFASGNLSLTFTADGHLWVGVPRTRTTWDLHLLDRAGNAAISTALPPSHGLAAATRSILWTTSRDDDDLHVLTRFRVR
jgi:hypothetical protein